MNKNQMKRLDTTVGPLEYAEIGNGIPLLFLHGALSNANTWHKVVAGLSGYCRCVLVDLPLGGHALPIAARTPVGAGRIAAAIVDVLNGLNLPDAVVFGNDTGGAYAQVLAAKYPDRVRALILSNCDCFEVFPPKQFQTLPKRLKLPGFAALMAALMRIPSMARSRTFMGALSTSLSGKDIVDNYVKTFIQDPRIRRDFRQIAFGWNPLDTLDAAQKLVGFAKPVLLLWGEEDKILFPPDLGRRLAAVFPDCRLVPVEAASTYVQEDNPGRCIEEIRAFVRRLRAPDPATP